MARKRKSLQFASVRAVENWLRNGEDGRPLLDKVIQEEIGGHVETLATDLASQWIEDAKRRRILERMAEREPVLVVLNADGWVEVYAYKETCEVEVVTRLDAGAGQESAADEWLHGSLPEKHAALYYPRYGGLVGQCKRVTPLDVIARECKLILLRRWREELDKIKTPT